MSAALLSPLGFSTMGDSSLTFEQAFALARQFDLQFLELRVLEGDLDLPAYFSARPELTVPEDGGVRVLSSSLQLISVGDEGLREFALYIALAQRLQARYIRVFGGGAWGDDPSEEKLLRAVEVVDVLRKMISEAGWSGEILLETHSAFSSSPSCERLNALLDKPLSLIWDSHHTWKIAGESPEETWSRLGAWTRHIHVKDSVSDSTAKEGYRYVVQGAGEFPAQSLIEVLARARYEGGISLEWEKLWHPELPELKDAMGPFVAVFRS
jgi:sugar phosphate isomerase/epimerase